MNWILLIVAGLLKSDSQRAWENQKQHPEARQ